MKKIIFLVLLLASTITSAQEYKFLVDKHWSPYSGATVVTSTYNFYKFIDDKYLPNGEGYTDMSWGFARAGKLSLDYILGSFLSVAQHEVFGHGYRAREFDFSYIGYEIHISSGATYFSSEDYYALNLYQQNSLNIAGMEATGILAQQVRLPWMYAKPIDYRDGLLYFLNQLDQFNYVYLTSGNDTSEGNDVNNYISGVNNYYGYQVLSNGKLRVAEMWDLFDPALYSSLYSIGKFIANGDPTTNLPMFKINKYQYLPTGHTILAPWGVEFQLQNFVLTPENSLYQVHLRYGSNSNITSYGIDFNVKPIWRKDRLVIGNQVSLWVQPSMKYANAATTKRQLGGAEFVNFEYKASKDVSFIGDIGYKTAGYMPGFLLSNNVIFRIGLKW